MVEYNTDELLSEVLRALSDATRRSLLTQLCQHGASRVTDLAEQYEISLNAISKHIKVLEKTELVTRRNIGRTHWIEANPARIELVQKWIRELKSIWEMRLEELNNVLQRGTLND